MDTNDTFKVSTLKSPRPSATVATAGSAPEFEGRVAFSDDAAPAVGGEVRYLYRSNAPKTFPCPDCGVRGRRVRKRVLEVADLEPGQRVHIIGTVGVYKAKCACCKYFTSEIREASKGTEYSSRVRDEVVRLVTSEHMTYEHVREHMLDRYFIRISIGTIHNWLKERSVQPARPRQRRARRAYLAV